MPSAWAFSIDARTSANNVSTAAASFGIDLRSDARRRETQIAILDGEQPLAKRGERPGAFAVRPFRGDVADQQAKSAGDDRRDDLLVQFGDVEECDEREDERGQASRARKNGVADFLGRACFHHACAPRGGMSADSQI